MVEKAGRVDRKEGAMVRGISQMECLGRDTFPEQHQLIHNIHRLPKCGQNQLSKF